MPNNSPCRNLAAYFGCFRYLEYYRNLQPVTRQPPIEGVDSRRIVVDKTICIHGLEIQHGNIKPSNILVKNRRVLLSDFGTSNVSLSFAGGIGVRSYCAPEVDDRSSHGQPSDIFSLGAVFLEMLIAHSCPSERGMLEESLGSGGVRSYAESADQVRWFIGTLKTLLQLDEWCHKVLS